MKHFFIKENKSHLLANHFVAVAGMYLQGTQGAMLPNEKFCMTLPLNRIIKLEMQIAKNGICPSKVISIGRFITSRAFPLVLHA